MIARMLDRLAAPWSVEFQVACGVAAGVALGLLIAGGGTVL